ncbi:helicase protein MOM1 isoform X2 [Diospyros lotus]|uniref:helicase protein MOM1 isoform X2 n=1 Tax=Diospyros lotus TaxID=55363 RepID=UPI002255CEC8|nr:helicase protein MOM1 isoform X2 [Diospyros lotus]
MTRYPKRLKRMANETRSSRRAKVDESNSVRKKPVLGKGSTTLKGDATSDASGSRRSARETPSRECTSLSPPSATRKSKRLEKLNLGAIPAKRKLNVVQQQSISTPFKRSDRSKKHQSLSRSCSRKSEKASGSSDIQKKKLENEKTVKQLVIEAKETSRREKQDSTPSAVEKKRMNARTYKSLLKQQWRKNVVAGEVERPDKSSHVDSSYCEGGFMKQMEDQEDNGDKCSENIEELPVRSIERVSEGGMERLDSQSNDANAKALRNQDELGSSCSSRKHCSSEESSKTSVQDGLSVSKNGQDVKETLDDADMIMQMDCSAVKKSKMQEMLASDCLRRSVCGNIAEGTGEKVASKRKRCIQEMDHNVSAPSAGEDVCTSIVDVFSSPSSVHRRDGFAGPCATCSKMRRLDYNSPRLELCVCSAVLNKDSLGTSIPKGRGKPEASISELVSKNDGPAQREESLSDVGIGSHDIICVICNHGGELLRCCGKGCKKNYHLSCLDPSLDDVPPGAWYCFLCVQKKIESGVHSVSEGIESIWDAREVEVQDSEGSRKQKQYLVKYRGLAHVHNHWIPETHLLLEAPVLVSEFNQKNQVMTWREEWRCPHRLLDKRFSRSPKQLDDRHSEPTADTSGGYHEWLVKWRGLDYQQVTWELENASFLHLPEAQSLVREYENRRQRAKRASSATENVHLIKKKLPKLSTGSSLNKLREYWHKGQNAIVINDQERVTNVVLFILSLPSSGNLPFLIISSSLALSLWEAEFSRLAPSTDVIVYSGNKDNRRTIRRFEFYEEGGCIMFQVLLSSVEAVVEDLDAIKGLRWETIIVDECQDRGVSKHFDQIKWLTAEVRILLFNNQLKDSVAEHLSLLSLLDSVGDVDSGNGTKTDLNYLRKRLSRFIAYDCKPDSSKFVEYWVPVLISDVQLEQYCHALLSNSTSLWSNLRNDPVGALRDILIFTRKCCDHPYIVDLSLLNFLTNGRPEAEFMDVGIKASGKLQLLDAVLSEIKGLRVVILFQSTGGSEKDMIGNILEQLLAYRFGPDSFERVDRGMILSKRQAALNKFNDMGSGKFVFLLEKRACVPSIKLSSVDAIVIFDSDWTPSNDLRALNKLSIDSSVEQIKVFRLYSSYTVEEKVLDLATHDLTLDSNLQNVSSSISHTLLMWGASYLFNKLDELHGGHTITSSKSISFETSHIKDVAREFLALLCQDAEDTQTRNSLVIKVQQVGANYRKDAPLFGELQFQLTDEEEPHQFWSKLLEKRYPRWRYLSGTGQRNRKRIQYFDELQKKPGFQTDEVAKKRKKLVNSRPDSRPTPREEPPGHTGGGSGVPANNGSHIPVSDAFVNQTLNTSHASPQKNLLALLKPEILKLCEVLQLSDNVKVKGEKFLEYIVENHLVSAEPTTILQAFQISLCWIAASLLKIKIDKKESLALAKKHLNFNCTEDEANGVHLKLRTLKKLFLQVENLKASESFKDSVLAAEDMVKQPPEARGSQSLAFNRVKVEVEERSDNQGFVENWLISEQDQLLRHKVEEAKLSESVRRIKKKLSRKHQEESRELDRRKEQLEEEYRLESALVRSIHNNNPVRLDKLKRLKDELAKKLEEHNTYREELRVKQLAESKEVDNWFEEVQCRVQAGLLIEQPLYISDTGGNREQQAREVAPSDMPRTSGTETVACNVTAENPTTPLCQNLESEPVNSIPAHAMSRVGFEQLSNLRSSADAPKNNGFMNQSHSAEQIPARNLSSTQEAFESAQDESMDGAAGLEIFNCDDGANGRDNEGDGLDMSVKDPLANQNVPSGNSSGHSVSIEPSLTKSPLVQPVVAPAQDDTMPQNLEECFQSSLPTGVHEGDAPADGSRNVLQQVEAPLLHPNHVGSIEQISTGSGIIEHSEQLELLPSTGSAIDHNQPDSDAASGIGLHPNLGHNVSQSVEAPHQLGPTEPLGQAVLQSGATSAPPTPTEVIDVVHGQSYSDLQLADGIGHPPNSEGCNSFQNVEPSSQPIENMTGLPNQVGPAAQLWLGLHPLDETALGGFGAHLPLHTARQMTSRMPPQLSLTDPLQNELERLRMEIEQATIVHEETKLRLKSDCEREIEEIIAGIRRKYDAKLQDAETEFLQKKKEFDTNQNKVFKHKSLAEAFRSKCLDVRSSGPSGLQVQLNLLSSQTAARTSPGMVPASVSPAASQPTAAPPVQVVHPSSALLSGMSCRPPHIIPSCPSFPVSGEIRAPAPHLQPFRSSASSSSAPAINEISLQQWLPSQQSQRNLSTASLSVSRVASRSPPLPPPLPPPPATNHSGNHDRGLQPEVMGGGLPSLQNSSLPVSGSLINGDNQPGGREQNILPSVSDMSLINTSLDLSRVVPSGSEGGNRGNLGPSGVAVDIVCLSDDD